jgi:hypothetical protein
MVHWVKQVVDVPVSIDTLDLMKLKPLLMQEQNLFLVGTRAISKTFPRL